MTRRVSAAMNVVARLGAARMGAVVVLAVAGGVATASPVTGKVTFQVSFDGSSWSNEIGIDGGMSYKMRAIAEWTDDGTASVGFANVTFEQIDLIGAIPADTYGLDTAFRRQGVPESWSIQAGTGASAGWLKIDRSPAANRTNLGQLPPILPGGVPNPSFSPDNQLVLFQMDCVYAFGNQNNITFSAPFTMLGTPATPEFKVYTTPTGTNKKPVEIATMEPALVRYVGPSPGTAGLLLFAGALSGRRRKR